MNMTASSRGAMGEVVQRDMARSVTAGLESLHSPYTTAHASMFDRAALRLILFNHAGVSSLPASKDAFASKACSGGVRP